MDEFLNEILAIIRSDKSKEEKKELLENYHASDLADVIEKLDEEERNEIQTLFERRNGLNELAKIVTADNTELYEKLVKDMGETGTKFQNWWDRMSQKYQWESAENGNWEINFDTCEITLVTE